EEYEENVIANGRSVRCSCEPGYSRVVVEALSNEVGFPCRIGSIATVVICTTQATGMPPAAFRVPGVQRGNRRRWGSMLNIITRRGPSVSRTGPAPHWLSDASFRESVPGRC